MRWISTLFAVFLCLLFTSSARATRVVLSSSDDPNNVTSEEKAKGPTAREMKTQKDRQEMEKRERLLQELQELYKPRRSGNE